MSRSARTAITCFAVLAAAVPSCGSTSPARTTEELCSTLCERRVECSIDPASSLDGCRDRCANDLFPEGTTMECMDAEHAVGECAVDLGCEELENLRETGSRCYELLQHRYDVCT